MTQAAPTALGCSPTEARRPALVTYLLTLLRPARPGLPLLDLDALSDHGRRDLGLADSRPTPRRDSFCC